VIAIVVAKNTRGTARRAAIAISNRKRTQYSEGLLSAWKRIVEILDHERVVVHSSITPESTESRLKEFLSGLSHPWRAGAGVKNGATKFVMD